MAVKVRERSGAWWVFVDYKGRRKARRVGVGREGKRAALVVAEKITAKLALGDLSPLEPPAPAPVTVREYMARWLETHARLRCKPSTVRHYRQILTRYWEPLLGGLPLTATALTRERIRAGLGGLASTLRSSTIRCGPLVALRTCLAGAVEDGLLPVNPAARLGRVVRSDVEARETVDPFTQDELSALLRCAETDWPAFYPVLLTLARTGLRFGELAGLEPDDLDFRERAVCVRRGVYRGVVSTTKTGKARRVDMSRQLAATLQGLLTLRQAEAVVSGQAPSRFLFPGPDGGPIEYRRALETWRAILRRSGVRYRGLHALRHTFATLLLQHGEPLPYVRDQLGHHSIKLTVDTYGHLIPGANRQAVDRLDTWEPRAEAPVPGDPEPASIRNLPATTDRAPFEVAR
jgi:integrase